MENLATGAKAGPIAATDLTVRLQIIGLTCLAASVWDCGGDGAREASDAEAAFSEISADDLGSAFERERVLALNAIVKRALDTVNAYDREIAEIRASVQAAAAPEADDAAVAAARENVARLGVWRDAAQAAKRDFDAEVAEIKESGEPYNESILAGMADFVAQVETELTAEAAAHERKLPR